MARSLQVKEQRAKSKEQSIGAHKMPIKVRSSLRRIFKIVDLRKTASIPVHVAEPQPESCEPEIEDEEMPVEANCPDPPPSYPATSLLPAEIWYDILDLVPLADHASLRRTCRVFHTYISEVFITNATQYITIGDAKKAMKRAFPSRGVDYKFQPPNEECKAHGCYTKAVVWVGKKSRAVVCGCITREYMDWKTGVTRFCKIWARRESEELEEYHAEKTGWSSNSGDNWAGLWPDGSLISSEDEGSGVEDEAEEEG